MAGAENPEGIEIEPARVADWLAREPTLQVIDVREPYEREAGHIAGTRHIELQFHVIFACIGADQSGNMLEKGTMEHPETGELEKFLLAWERVSIDEGPKIGWVWKVEGKEMGIRGLFIRIGSVAQGIYRQGEEVKVGRTIGIDAENGWVAPSFSFGKGDVSFTELFFDEAHLGQSFVGKFGEIWECVESFTWT